MAKMTTEERREIAERKAFFTRLEQELKTRNEAHVTAGEPEEVYIFAYVPLKYIKTDDKYQRDLDKTRIEIIKSNFDPYMVDVKKINYRDGWGHVWEGKHTASVLENIKLTTIPAMVSFGKSYEWEAGMFRNQLKYTRRPNSTSRYLAGVEEKEEKALAIKAELDKRGITTSRNRRRNETHNIYAFAKVLSIYEKFGIEGMNLTLDIIIESGYAKFEGGFTTLMFEIGKKLCELGVKYNSPQYITILNEMRYRANPEKFYNICGICYSDKKGQHGEGCIREYVKATLGVIPMSDEHKIQLGLL